MNNNESSSAAAANALPNAGAQPGRMTEHEHADKMAAGVDAAALTFFKTATSGLLPDEADAWASVVSAAAVQQAIIEKRDMVVVDVRAAEDYANGHIPGAVNLPRENWASAVGLSKEKLNVVYCYSHTCPLGGEACATLAEQGYPVVEMDGGFEIWQSGEPDV